MEVKQLDLVHFKDRQKKIGEWGDETGVESVDEDRVEPFAEPAAGRPHLGDAVLVGARRHQVLHPRDGLPGDAGLRHRSREGRAARRRRRRAGPRRGLALLLVACSLGCHRSPEEGLKTRGTMGSRRKIGGVGECAEA